jgi:hypothetical protein
MALISEQADCFALSEKRRERPLNEAFTPACNHSAGILCAAMRMTSGHLRRQFLVLLLGALRRLARTWAALTIGGAAAFVGAAVRFGSLADKPLQAKIHHCPLLSNNGQIVAVPRLSALCQ